MNNSPFEALINNEASHTPNPDPYTPTIDPAQTLNTYRQPEPRPSTHSPAGSHSHIDVASPAHNPESSTDHSPSFQPVPDFLSPGYSSELSEQTTPGFADEFYFNEGLAPMPGVDFGEVPDAYGEEGAVTYRTLAPVAPQPLHAKSASLGGTTVATQLLSPQLTGTPSPRSEYKTLNFGVTSAAGVDPGTKAFPDMAAKRGRVYLQTTPTLTGSSRSESIENSAAERAPSPLVRIESWSRGDSPAGRNVTKRNRGSRSSAHLSVGQSDSEGDGEPEYDRQRLPSVPFSSTTARAEDGSWVRNVESGQAGLDPTTRDEQLVPSLKDIEAKRAVDEKNAEVAEWLEHSDAGSAVGDNESPFGGRLAVAATGRPRARTTGQGQISHLNPLGIDTRKDYFDDSAIPGPGVLIDEDSEHEGDDEDDEDDESEAPESPPTNVDMREAEEDEDISAFPTIDEDPLPRQFYVRPWQDPPRGTGATDTKWQPGTSNAAMMRFQLRADSIETASRAATWGTRRLSDSDIDKIIGSNSFLRKLQIGGKDKTKESRPRKGSFLSNAAEKILPKRSNSNLKKRKQAEAVEAAKSQNNSSDSVDKVKRDSLSSLAPPERMNSWDKIQRKASFSKSKSPPKTTEGALASMVGITTAIGGSSHMGNATPVPSSPLQPSSAWESTKGKSEVCYWIVECKANMDLKG